MVLFLRISIYFKFKRKEAKMKRKLIILTMALALTMGFAMQVPANVPAPPANQQLGIDDGVFNNLVEADCRFCHEDPLVVDPGTIPDRHHLLIGTPVPDPTSRPFPDGDTNGNYDCYSCHNLIWDPDTMTYQLETFRDCLFCHQQIPGQASVHHLLPVAQGTNSPLGDPNVGDCTPCHGTLVDDTGDGHIIPTYAPSLVTPSPSEGEGLPLNSEGKGAGACNYCHSSGTGTSAPGTDTATGTLVYRNQETHHGTGFGLDGSKCLWCHDTLAPEGERIRRCEECHGFESLHNIQLDSPAAGNVGDIVPGAEDAYWGHIGNNDDCWGCHGFVSATAAGTGPVVPYISSSDTFVVTAGTDTTVTLTGVAFTNMVMDVIELASEVDLTASDGSTTTLTPDSITESEIVVTLPGSLTVGNYDLRAVKGHNSSNPVVLSVTPAVVITDSSCNRKKGVLTINGSGFGKKIEGTDDYINVEVNGMPADIISWSDTKIRTSISRCKNTTVTVNALYGSAMSGGGKPDKPCKGKGCNK
jgi:hypothetical protein